MFENKNVISLLNLVHPFANFRHFQILCVTSESSEIGGRSKGAY
jgi:hypothetical protein